MADARAREESARQQTMNQMLTGTTTGSPVGGIVDSAAGLVKGIFQIAGL
jgi:hypothetical protein